MRNTSQYWETYEKDSEKDDSVEIGYNKTSFRKNKRDEIPEEFREHLGPRPYDTDRPEYADGFVPTDIVDPLDSSETVVLTDMSHAEIWDYFAKMAEVMTYNMFVALIAKEYDKLREATDIITKGVRIRSHIPEYPVRSDSLKDYLGLLRELQYVTSILWKRRPRPETKTTKVFKMSEAEVDKILKEAKGTK